MWIIDPTKRSFGTKIVSVWIGILAAHPLLFFLLGFAFVMMANSVSTFGNNLSLHSLVNLTVAVIALFLAACSPLLLMKLAPVIPQGFGGTQGPAFSAAAIGPSNMSDATSRLGRTDTGASREGRQFAGRGSTASGVQTAAPEAQGTSLAAASAVRAGASTAAASGAAAGGAAAGGSAAAGTMAAAGAAESATGVGAAVGIPTLIAAAAVVTASKAAQFTEAAGAQATAALDDNKIGPERTP